MGGVRGHYIYDDKGEIIGATGGLKTAMTNKAKYGKDFYKKMGGIGGTKSTGYAFGHGKVDPHEAGRKGGSVSKRGKARAK